MDACGLLAFDSALNERVFLLWKAPPRLLVRPTRLALTADVFISQFACSGEQSYLYPFLPSIAVTKDTDRASAPVIIDSFASAEPCLVHFPLVDLIRHRHSWSISIGFALCSMSLSCLDSCPGVPICIDTCGNGFV